MDAVTPEDRNAALWAGVLFAALIAFSYFLPSLMLAAGNWSTAGGVVVAALFLVLPFIVLWLRGRARRRGD